MLVNISSGLRLSLFLMVCVLFGCQPKESRSQQGGTSPSPDRPVEPALDTSSGQTGSTNQSTRETVTPGVQVVGKSFDDCSAANAAWVPVVQGGQSPAQCRGELVPWCCSPGEVVARFPGLTDANGKSLANFIDERLAGTGQGPGGQPRQVPLKMYHCAQVGPREYHLHFVARARGITHYEVQRVVDRSPTSGTGSTVNCPTVTATDLGFAPGPGTNPQG